MPKIQESPMTTISQTENIVQECRERIWQALEADTHKLRERAESESSQILDNARREAEKTITQAREEASAESERIIALAKEEATEIIRQSREGAAKAQQESARMINETRLLTQLSKSVEQTICETGTNIKVKLERLAGIIAEAESTLQSLNQEQVEEAESTLQPLNGVQVEEAEVIPPEETEEKVAPKAYSSQGLEKNLPEDDRSESKFDENARLFKGRVKLEVIRPFDQERLAGVPEWLVKMKGLKVTSTGCYARANRWITMFTLDLQHPLPLLEIFMAVPTVKDVTEHKGSLVVVLK